MKLIITVLVLYILYKLIFDYVIPISRSASDFKQKVNQMRKMQEEQFRQNDSQYQNNRESAVNQKTSTTTTDGEYIDYEEVK